MIFSTYGYIEVAKNIYDIEAFYAANQHKIQFIRELTHDLSGDIGLTFECDEENRILIAYSIFGATSEEREENYARFHNHVSSSFPFYKTLVKITTKIDGTDEYFNDTIYEGELNG